MENRTNSIKVNYILNLVRNIMKIIFPLISFPYVSRILNPEGLGRVNFAHSVVEYFVLLSSLGIPIYAIREGVKYRNKKEDLGKFSTEILIINIVLCIISYFLFSILLFMPYFERYRILLIVSSFTMIFNMIGMEWLFSILEDFKYITIRSILIQFISIICLFIFVKTESDYIKYAIINVGATSVSNIYNFIYSKKFIKLFKYKNYSLKKRLKPIGIIAVMTAAANIYMNSDMTMLGIFKGDATVGLYTVAVRINRIFTTLISSISTVLLARLSYYVKNRRLKEYNELLDKAMNFVLMLSIPCCYGLIILSNDLLIFFSGTGYLEADLTIRLLAFNILLAPINGIISYQILLPFDKEYDTMIAAGLGCFINVILNLIFIPILSQNGAAITTILAELSVFIYKFYVSRDIINIKYLFRNIWQYLLSAIAIMPIYFLSTLIIKERLVLMINTFILSVIFYFLLLLLLHNSLAIEAKNILFRKIKRYTK